MQQNKASAVNAVKIKLNRGVVTNSQVAVINSQ